MKPDQLQTPQGALAHEDPQNDQMHLPQAKHSKHGTLRQTSMPDPRCFLCFSKDSKTNFPKQFIIDLFVVSKRYFILSLSLQDWKSSVVILSVFFVRNYEESLHLMGILKGNGAHPPLYFCMYHMFFFSLGSCSYLLLSSL